MNSSFIIINVDETVIDKEILEFIIDSLIRLEKPLCKIVFVELTIKMKNHVRKRNKDTYFTLACLDDYEKAKEWLI